MPRWKIPEGNGDDEELLRRLRQSFPDFEMPKEVEDEIKKIIRSRVVVRGGGSGCLVPALLLASAGAYILSGVL